MVHNIDCSGHTGKYAMKEGFSLVESKRNGILILKIWMRLGCRDGLKSMSRRWSGIITSKTDERTYRSKYENIYSN